MDLLIEENEGIFSDMYKSHGFYTGADFHELGKRVGLRIPVVASVLNTYFQRESDIIHIINNSFMPEEMKAKAILLVQDRIKSLKIRD